MEEVVGDVDIAVEVPLHSLPLTPSHMSLTQVRCQHVLSMLLLMVALLLNEKCEAAIPHVGSSTSLRARSTRSTCAAVVFWLFSALKFRVLICRRPIKYYISVSLLSL